jgi:hypothetical protein
MSSDYFLDRITGRASQIRAADADREQTAERLRKAHAEGRLDIDEFQERLERCYEAKTFGELGELVRDLPRQSERQPVAFRPWRWALVPLLPILVLIVALSAMTGHEHHHVFWILIPLAFLLLWRISWSRRRAAGGRRGPGSWI